MLMKSQATFSTVGFLGLALAACNNQQVAVKTPSAAEAGSLRIIAHAEKYCREEHYQPGTAHFDDCVKNKAISDALEEMALQQVASGQTTSPSPPAQIYVQAPTNSTCIPDVRGMSAGAAFAAGMRGC